MRVSMARTEGSRSEVSPGSSQNAPLLLDQGGSPGPTTLDVCRSRALDEDMPQRDTIPRRLVRKWNPPRVQPECKFRTEVADSSSRRGLKIPKLTWTS